MKLILAFAMAAIIMSQLLLAFGLSTPVIAAPEPPEVPVAESGGFFDQVRAIIESVIAPMRYVVNSIGAFVQFMVFQIDSLPDVVNLILVTPFWFAFGYIFIRLIRGGG